MKNNLKALWAKIVLTVLCVCTCAAGVITLGTKTAYATTALDGGTVEAEEGVAVSGSEGEEIPPHEHAFEDNNCYCGEHSHDDGATLFKTWAATSGSISESGIYYLTSDITATGNITITSAAEITLCLNGYTLDMQDFTISNSGVINVYDCQGTGKITGSNATYLLINGKEFNLYGGALVADSKMTYGVLYSSGATANIYGGAINGVGKAIYNQSGSTLNVFDGTIISSGYYAIENNGSSGKISTVNITGGRISGTVGVASTNSYTSIDISGNPIITGSNTGVLVRGDNDVISGGAITGETNDGVHLSGSGTLTISGGIISGSRSGVYNFGELTVTGGTITGVTHGIYNVYATSYVLVTGGTVTATAGNGITSSSSSGSTVEILGGEIIGSTYGVNITKSDMKVYLASNPTITGGTASIRYTYNGLVYAHSADESVAYSGQTLTLNYNSPANGVVAVQNVTEDNKDKFTLTNSDYILLLGTDENSDDLILHKHAYSAVHYNETNHWTECSCGAKSSETAHGGGSATCEQKAVCTTCLQEYGELANHIPEEDDGNCMTDILCSVCEEVTTKGNADHSYAYTANGHVITETCSVEGCTAHTATATIVAPEETLIYSGLEMKATVAYSDNWQGGTLTVSYTRNGLDTTDCINVGELKATIKVNEASASVAYTVAAKEVSIYWVSDSFTYNGSDQKSSVTAYYLDINSQEIPLTVTLDGEFKNYTEGGYIFTAAFADGETNYALPDVATKTYHIQKLDIAHAEITIGAALTYNGQPQTQTVERVVLNGLTVTCDISGNTATNVGVNDYTLTVTGNGNFCGTTNKSWNLAKATYNMQNIAFEDGVFTYDGSEHSIAITGTLPTGVEVTYSANNAQIDATTSEITVTASFTGDSTNYHSIDDMTATITVNKANAAITVDTTAIVKTYGEIWALPEASANFGTPTANLTVAQMKDTGSYTLLFTVAGTDNYNGDSKSISVTINKATYDMSGVTFSDDTVKYDGKAHSLTIAGNLPEGVTVVYTDNGKTDADVYTVTASFVYDTANYNEIPAMTATLTINRAELLDHATDSSSQPNVIVTNESGFAPNVEIVITEKAKENNAVEEVLRLFDKVSAVYDVTMEADGVAIQPNGEITIKLLIPEDILGKNFRIFHNHNGEFTEIEYTVDGDYAVFTVDKLSEFSFVYYEFPWWIAIVAAVFVGAIAIVVIRRKRDDA